MKVVNKDRFMSGSILSGNYDMTRLVIDCTNHECREIEKFIDYYLNGDKDQLNYIIGNLTEIKCRINNIEECVDKIRRFDVKQ